MKKYLPIIVVASLWTWTPIFVKLLSFHFDNFTQNFYRYFAGSLVLIIISLIFYRKKLFDCLNEIKSFILPAILLFVFQTAFVAGIYMLTPTVAALISRSSVFFTIIFSFIFFADERRIIKSTSFIFGSFLAIIGVCGVIIGKGSLYLASFNFGAALMLISSVAWALYTIVMKTRLQKTDPFVSASIIFTLVLPLFLVFALLFGNINNIKTLSTAPKGIILILFLSGIFCVGMGNVFNYKSIKLIGVVISSNFRLITPFFTAIFSYIIFKEVLTVYQILFGAILLVGCSILMKATH